MILSSYFPELYFKDKWCITCFKKKEYLDSHSSSRTVLSLILTALMQHEALCCDSNVNHEASLCVQTVIFQPNSCWKETVLPGRNGTGRWDSSQSKSVIHQPCFQIIVIKSKAEWSDMKNTQMMFLIWHLLWLIHENTAHPWQSASLWIWTQLGGCHYFPFPSTIILLVITKKSKSFSPLKYRVIQCSS